MVAAGLAADLGAATTINVSDNPVVPAAGDARVNAATGKREVFQGGFWLPLTRFAVAPATCRDQSDAALSRNKVNFVSGKARLDGQSTRAVNDMAAVILRCLSEGTLTV
jgi:hypothetical protein